LSKLSNEEVHHSSLGRHMEEALLSPKILTKYFKKFLWPPEKDAQT
jgi:hypothetical protein